MSDGSNKEYLFIKKIRPKDAGIRSSSYKDSQKFLYVTNVFNSLATCVTRSMQHITHLYTDVIKTISDGPNQSNIQNMCTSSRTVNKPRLGN